MRRISRLIVDGLRPSSAAMARTEAFSRSRSAMWMRSSSRRYLVDDGTGSRSTRTGARRRFGSMRPFRHSRPVRSWTPTRRLALCWSAPSARAGSIPPARHAASWAPAASAPCGSRSPSHPLSWGAATTTRTDGFGSSTRTGHGRERSPAHHPRETVAAASPCRPWSPGQARGRGCRTASGTGPRPAHRRCHSSARSWWERTRSAWSWVMVVVISSSAPVASCSCSSWSATRPGEPTN